jgi:hypothetical protein
MINGSLENVLVSMFESVKGHPAAHLVKLKTVFDRIRSEKSMPVVQKVRTAPDKETANEIKKTLPIICFSGEFSGARDGKNLSKHSNLICLDFDKMTPDEIEMRKEFLIKLPYVVAVFVSPSGNGIKVVVRILDGSKHAQHYASLLKEFPDADISTKDVARACFDCADKDIYTNYSAIAYSKIIEVEKEKVYVKSNFGKGEKPIAKIEKWLDKRRTFYQSGSRNNFIFILASACCRIGVEEAETAVHIQQNYLASDNEFTVKEMQKAIQSAYKNNKFGSAEFSNESIVEKTTSKEIEIDLTAEIEDVIYGLDCFADAANIYHNGYESAESTGIKEIDRIFKWKRGELTLLSGIGNFGKSEWLNFLMLNKSAKDGTKWGVFSPENNPASEFYHHLTEMVIGANCTPTNSDGTENKEKPPFEIYESVYKFVSDHIFYIYPKELAPTPEYIRSRFLELIVKEKIDGCIIDPFNQLSNDYGTRDDKYLETFLSECLRFAVRNNVFYVIIAHPHKLQKDKDTKGYPCPDVFDLAGGAMWNNKADNILVYHRPNHHTDPMDRLCEMHSKKIRRQKIVGMKGVEQFDYSRSKRRFIFDEYPLKRFIEVNKMEYRSMDNVRNFSEPNNEETTPF